jgi:regulator of nucleoside diphosphate kinase
VAKRPSIVISSIDLDRLERLLESLPTNAFPGKTALETELSRAEVVEPSAMPPTVVTMNSTVKFKVDTTAEEFCLTLVYPKDMDAKSGTISILAPVGSALLGLAEGDEIEWPKPGGGTLQVRIEQVVHQPERAGEFHR